MFISVSRRVGNDVECVAALKYNGLFDFHLNKKAELDLKLKWRSAVVRTIHSRNQSIQLE